MQKKCIFFVEIFGQFKKKLYLCTRFWETNVFRFSTGRPDIKIQIHLCGPNFFAPNWRIDEANWKIDTISVVQEQKNISAKFGGCEFPKISTLDKSIILSYLINFFYNEEFDPGSGWTLATGLTHASRGAARKKLAFSGGDRRTGA